jgi:DNA replication protein DnaC
MNNFLKITTRGSKKQLKFLSFFEQEKKYMKTVAPKRLMKSVIFLWKSYWGIYFEVQSSIDKKVIENFATLKSILNAKNVVLFYTFGVGKSHIIIALEIEAVKVRISVYYLWGAENQESHILYLGDEVNSRVIFFRLIL